MTLACLSDTTRACVLKLSRIILEILEKLQVLRSVGRSSQVRHCLFFTRPVEARGSSFTLHSQKIGASKTLVPGVPPPGYHRLNTSPKKKLKWSKTNEQTSTPRRLVNASGQKKTPGVPLQVHTKLAHASTAAADTDPLRVCFFLAHKRNEVSASGESVEGHVRGAEFRSARLPLTLSPPSCPKKFKKRKKKKRRLKQGLTAELASAIRLDRQRFIQRTAPAELCVSLSHFNKVLVIYM